ncbi:FecR family protein [Novosphingobium malaysiense]|uniref:FecR protein domain-containing protein n=1 Tax=Novosphingobium malaysiense TaxID=1348853 RepID=A0A0B1ZQ69_9SPHN|nr:FecR domain-containing protein [Novosphingobium malaysiense]KHK91398.1 hypothetical protein LK12_11135 [Novosphingobium malaysiense]
MPNKAKAAAAVVTAACILATVPVDGQEVVGINTAVRNDVKVKRDAQSDYRPAVVKEKVALGNRVRTGKSSALQVTLLDRSNLTVGPNANFTVDRFVYDPAKNASSVGASVVKGTFRFMSGKAQKVGSHSVKTPAATIGIRGTMLEGAVGEDAMIMAQQQRLSLPGNTDPSTATMVVLRGPGPNAQMGEHPGMIDVNAGGKTVTLNSPGQALFIPYPGAQPIGPFQLNVPTYSSFDVVLRTAPGSFAGTMAALQAGATGGVASGEGAGQSGSSRVGSAQGSSRGGTIASSSVSSGFSTTALVGLGTALGTAGIIAATSSSNQNAGSGGV